MSCMKFICNESAAKFIRLPMIGKNLFSLRKSDQESRFDIVFYLHIQPNTICNIYQGNKLLASKTSDSNGLLRISENEPLPLCALNNADIILQTNSPEVICAGNLLSLCQRKSLIVYPDDQLINNRYYKIIGGKFYF
jgi:hypothetical protein